MYILSAISRYFLCLIPYLILVTNSDIIYHITGPITISPFNNQNTYFLIYYIAIMQFFRIFYNYFTDIFIFIFKKISNKKSNSSYYPYYADKKFQFLQKMTFKYSMVIIMKLVLFFYSLHRMKYYLHVFFLQLFILSICILADVINNRKVSQTLDIIAIDGFNRIAVFYQLTRTFNPNFGLYFFGNNLLVLIVSQLQGRRYEVLYVKHDIYRIMVITIGYSCLFSLLQCSITYQPLIIFIITFYFFFMSIKQFNQVPSTQGIKQQQSQQQQNLKLHPNQHLDQFDKLFRKFFMMNLVKQSKQSYFIRKKKFVIKYIKRINGNKPLKYFMLVVIGTVLIEMLWIFVVDQYKKNPHFNNQMTLNSFQSFLNNMKTNGTSSLIQPSMNH